MPRKVLIQIRRGTETELSGVTLAPGELGYTTDTKKLYIGTATGNVLLVNVSTAGDMLKSVYDTDNDGKVDLSEAADSVPWTGVTGKPSTFPPSTHNHDQVTIPDTRSVATVPSDYSRNAKLQFKQSSVVGLSGGTYSVILGFAGWGDDSGGPAFELGFQSDGVVKIRWGTRASGWGDWATLWHPGPVTWNQLAGV